MDPHRGRRRPYGERSPGQESIGSTSPRPKVFRGGSSGSRRGERTSADSVASTSRGGGGGDSGPSTSRRDSGPSTSRRDSGPSTSRHDSGPSTSRRGGGGDSGPSTSRRDGGDSAPSTSRRGGGGDRGPNTSRGGGGDRGPYTSRGGGGDSGPSTSRGGAPPRREINPRERYEIVHTRPAEIRTKKGTDGTVVKLKTNYYRLKTKPTWAIQIYDVTFEPELGDRYMQARIIGTHKHVLGGFLYDGKQLFTTSIFESLPLVLTGTTKEGIDYSITIKKVGMIEATDWQYLQVLNLILRRAMVGLKLQQVGRNLYDAAASIHIREHCLQLWPGYDTSIRQHERDILLCAELTHKVMRTETVYDIMCQLLIKPDNFQEDFRRAVVGMTVLTDYNNMTYRINDIDFNSSPLSEFEYKGEPTSFMRFYKLRHNINIKDTKQPLLVSTCKEKAQSTRKNDIVVLIPELCRATGMTEQMRNNFQLMSALAQHTRMGPEKRMDRLRIFNRRLQQTEQSQEVLTNWNMKLDDKLVEFDGRVMDPQKIVFRDNLKVSAGPTANWTNSFRNCKMLTTPSRGVERWVYITTQRCAGQGRSFVGKMRSVARGLGLLITEPREFLVYDERVSSYIQALDECCRQDPQFILCFVPNNNSDRYNAIKKVSCVDRAVPTQVITLRTANNNRGLMSIATKVAIQINCKLGYTPWMVALPLNGLMTIGFDIAKSTRDRSKAYCAMIATMDLPSNATFYSNVIECNAHDVMANSLWPMIMKALRQFRQEHKQLPKRIVIYRDGLSAGALKQAYEHEVKEIVENLTEEYKRAEREPMFAYIVVTKALKTRLFLAHGGRDRGNENPPPGTVVDDVITQPEWYDFFLVSQHVNQGTVSPTSYNVLHSNIRLTPDQIQQLTYKMAHLYYNWSGTTRVPSVVQYAKKLATLVATNIHQIPNNALEKKFYYL